MGRDSRRDFWAISDLQLELDKEKELLLDSANSLLEWDVFMGINPVPDMLQIRVSDI